MKYQIFSVIAAIFLLSCSESKKVQKAITTLNAHPDKAAEYCGNKFPPRDSIGTVHDTLYKANNTDYSALLDTLLARVNTTEAKAQIDSIEADKSHTLCKQVVADQSAENKKLRNEIASIRASYKPCVPDTIIRTVNIYRSNTAKEIDLGNKLAVSQSTAQGYKDKFEWWKIACLITWAVILLYIGLRVFGSRIGISKL